MQILGNVLRGYHRGAILIWPWRRQKKDKGLCPGKAASGVNSTGRIQKVDAEM